MFYITVFRMNGECHKPVDITRILPSFSCSSPFLFTYFFFHFYNFLSKLLGYFAYKISLAVTLLSIGVKRKSRLRIITRNAIMCAKLREVLPFYDGWCGTSFGRRWLLLDVLYVFLVPHPIKDHALYPLTSQN